MKTFKLHLIRHGLTSGNLQGLYIGSGTDIPLCDEGRAQLAELKERFEYPQVDTVFSSPLMRAVETANILFPNATHQFSVHDLREAGFGVFENHPVKELVKNEDFKKWITPGSGFVPEGAEPTEQFHARCSETLLKLFEYMIRMDVTEAEVDEVIGLLQEFDPPGIGARTLQECLLLQIARRPPSRLKELMEETVRRYFDDFTKKHWDRLRSVLSLTEIQAETLIAELRRLNPKPGAAMGETVGRGMHQITPDFIVDTNDDGSVTFALNTGEIPELHVSQSFADTLKEYQDNRAGMSRQMKEALLYTKKKVAAAQGFIEAVKVRRRTLTVTMQAIIRWQHRFFEDGDEASLRPMILKDIAERTGLDISTISRVSNSKYAQTRWGTFPLRHFFSDSYVTESGEELSTRSIKAALRDIVDAEDKRRPLNDDAIREQLAAKGYPIARRTVAKYREQLGIPIARLRK